VHVQAPGVVALRDPAQFLAQAVVVGRVDDRLVEVVRPRVGTGRGQRQPLPVDQAEQAPAPLALQLCRLTEALGPARADLDLGGDQLAGGRLGQDLVALAGGVELLEAVLELERRRVDDRELLLEPDREVGLGLESLADEVEVQGQGLSQVEVERVEQVDGGAGGVDRHVRRHLQ
jgi:hypothetical protein